MLKTIPLFMVFLIVLVKIQSIYSSDNLYTSSRKNIYYIENEKKYNWMGALIKCASMNMTLVTIDTKEKSNEITDLLRNTFGNVNPLWIGAITSGANPLEYVWISTGNKFTFTNWAPGQPDFYMNQEYCVQTGWSDEIKWNDHYCFTNFGVICEYDHWKETMEVELQEQLAKQQQLKNEADSCHWTLKNIVLLANDKLEHYENKIN
ncbi:lectin subunit alpha-like [Lucilia cuprina]|uniref:lectin subunit alpha-like n=1 Tax=Lucilia cuprina TaxID=7375 RepID=UPI001F058A48|nr:lectin subunit alpha-like [Lucilia cuprina]